MKNNILLMISISILYLAAISPEMFNEKKPCFPNMQYSKLYNIFINMYDNDAILEFTDAEPTTVGEFFAKLDLKEGRAIIDRFGILHPLPSLCYMDDSSYPTTFWRK
jgi:hypothetical protein